MKAAHSEHESDTAHRRQAEGARALGAVRGGARRAASAPGAGPRQRRHLTPATPFLPQTHNHLTANQARGFG